LAGRRERESARHRQREREREREREKEREREREIAPVGERNGWLTDFREERERERFP
jgi:hypothetical protein